ncbi:MAG: 50S ribosomal protein L15 [Oligoflexia bacterium]|nr:50S ribosomal protein L15 [Oligoflexia bacterium]
MSLTNIRSAPGAHRNTKRLGRGPGSGQGCQAGKGHKGQKARNGGGVRIGFEGNNLPMYMRLPKARKFTNEVFKQKYAIVNLSDVYKKFTDSETVTKEKIVATRLLKGKQKHLPIKIILKHNAQLSKKLVFEKIDCFSKGAKDAVLKSGGAIL